jgi:hypothetical protein
MKTEDRIPITKDVMLRTNYDFLSNQFISPQGNITVCLDGVVLLYRRHVPHVKFFDQLQDLHWGVNGEKLEIW